MTDDDKPDDVKETAEGSGVFVKKPKPEKPKEEQGDSKPE